MPPPTHLPVLLAETLALLDPHPGETYLDCTAGLGGHAAAIAQRLGPTGTVILFDLDPANLAAAALHVRASAPNPPTILSHHASFSDAPRILAASRLRANLALADLGFASHHVDDPARGFSFMRDGPLDMRLDPTSPVTAAELVNTLPPHELAAILRHFGEEPAARRIAENLALARARQPITTTARLAEVVRAAAGPSRGKKRIDPATRTFQALRIAVNDELGRLSAFLDALRRAARTAPAAGDSWLAAGARLAVISFHSLEDRLVKRTFASLVHDHAAAPLSRKPLTASHHERDANPRSRSAKLRAVRLSPIS